MVFDIERGDNRTAVSVPHVGPVPEFECNEVCSGAWTHHLNAGLRASLRADDHRRQVQVTVRPLRMPLAMRLAWLSVEWFGTDKEHDLMGKRRIWPLRDVTELFVVTGDPAPMTAELAAATAREFAPAHAAE